MKPSRRFWFIFIALATFVLTAHAAPLPANPFGSVIGPTAQRSPFDSPLPYPLWRLPFDSSLDHQFRGVSNGTVKVVSAPIQEVLISTGSFSTSFGPAPQGSAQAIPSAVVPAQNSITVSQQPSSNSSLQTTFISPLRIQVGAGPQTPALGSVSYEAITGTNPNVVNPLDPNLAVGPADLILIMNRLVAIYDKSNPGNLLQASSFNDWFNGAIPAGTDNIFDPRVIYDRWNSRFIIVTAAKNSSAQQAFYFIAVSQQPSAIGSWLVYAFDAKTSGSTVAEWADRPCIGVDGNNLYITSNMYSFASGVSAYAKIRVYQLSDLYSGTPSPPYVEGAYLTNIDGSQASTLQPADRYGSIGDMFLINAASSGNLTLWHFTDPFGSPTLTKMNISVQAFSNPPSAQQPGTTTTLNTGDDRLLQAQYRGSGIWAVQQIGYDFGSGLRSVVRLYEIKSDGSGLFNQITFGSQDYFFFYPAIATDQNDDLIVSFSLSSRSDLVPGLYPSLAYAGRRVQDPQNTIQNVVIVKSGESFYTQGSTNPTLWGDYSGTTLDPIDNTTFWMFNEYGKAGNHFSTWVANATYFPNRVFLPMILR